MYNLIKNAKDYCQELKECDDVHEMDNQNFPKFAVACGTAESIKGKYTEIKKKHMAVFEDTKIENYINRICAVEYYEIPIKTFLYDTDILKSIARKSEDLENMSDYLQSVMKAYKWGSFYKKMKKGEEDDEEDDEEIDDFEYSDPEIWCQKLEGDGILRIVSNIKLQIERNISYTFDVISDNCDFWICNLSKTIYEPDIPKTEKILKKHGMTDMIKMPCELKDEVVYAIHNNISREFPDTFQNDERKLHEKIFEDEHDLV